MAVASNAKAGFYLRILILIALAAGAIWISQSFSKEEMMRLIDRSKQMGWPGYLFFILVYAIWVTLGLPASVMSLGAAVAFGFWLGCGVVFAGALLGAMLGFLTARYIAKAWFEKLVSKRIGLAQIDRAVGEGGWKFVVLTRLPPVSPFSILNYAYGLTPVTFGSFVLGTAIGMVPGTMAYIYLGTILGAIAQGERRQRTPAEWAFYIGGFVITAIVTIYLVKMAKAALAKHSNQEIPLKDPPPRQSPPATPN
jgi:uncharacterized membrane protein YdjX (TVP38/TMEM64 family)